MLAHRLTGHRQARAQFVERLPVLGPQPVEQLAAASSANALNTSSMASMTIMCNHLVACQDRQTAS